MKLFASLELLCLLVSQSAHSEAMTGNELLQKLSAKDLSAYYYLVGIVDAAEASRLVFSLNIMKTDENVRVAASSALGQYWGCRPEKASYGQVADITIAYLNSHPKIRHLNAGMIIATAMNDAWPCTQ